MNNDEVKFFLNSDCYSNHSPLFAQDLGNLKLKTYRNKFEMINGGLMVPISSIIMLCISTSEWLFAGRNYLLTTFPSFPVL